jgi:GT2 family glycosyltransferase
MIKTEPEYAVVIPAHQAESTLDACISGVLESGFARGELLVVDDGSTDRTAAIARSHDVRVLSNATPLRPARARNRGVEAVTARVVLFVDADVVLRGGVRARLSAHFRDPAVHAVIGSYDDRPDAGSVVSDYRNLLHHYVHQRAGGRSDTFWTGIGAVRRDEFLRLGGLRPDWENIEDVEFGLRLTGAGGTILLDPAIQGTHLKVWTPRSMFRTDLHGRAVPWTRLLRSGAAPAGRLNTTLPHRIAALGVAAALAALPLALLWAPAIWLLPVGAAAFLAASLPFLAALGRLRGPGFALCAAPWHALHYVAALLGYAKVRLGLAGRTA